MESRGLAPRVGVARDALDIPTVLIEGVEPTVSLYLRTAVDDVTAPAEIATRWRKAREELERGGAPSDVLEGIDALVPDAHTRGDAMVVFGRRGGSIWARSLDPGISADRWQVAPVVALGPLVGWIQARVPYLAVLVDHAGADLFALDADGVAQHETVGDAGRGDRTLHLAQPGGWSQARFQRRVKNQWRANAGDAAARLVQLFDERSPRLVAVGGDIRAVQMLNDQLPSRVRDAIVGLDVTRAADGAGTADAATVQAELATALDDAAARDTVAVAQALRAEIGRGEGAVTGVGATLDALRAAAVDILVVHDDPDDRRTVMVGVTPSLVGRDAEELRAMGETVAVPVPMADALIRAAFATGATVRVVPTLAALDEGVGAILRH